MNGVDEPAAWTLLDRATELKLMTSVGLLTLFWLWETWRPFLDQRLGRWRHAGRNVSITLLNAFILAFTTGAAIVLLADWTEARQWGALNLLPAPFWPAMILGVIILDAATYCWHRANHVVPFLWRFHRMHHSDPRMDVTTATRFHLGEHLGYAIVRLTLIPLAGLRVEHIVVYEGLLLAVTHFHHANISLGRFDRWVRLIVVTPDMHKVHHSRRVPETNSNYSSVLSIWDRIGRTFRLRRDPSTIEFGLEGWDDSRWQTVWGMLRTPVRDGSADNDDRTAEGPSRPSEKWSDHATKPGARVA
jgi:sterol desaturase/sphingolipid hydroxylase (fatty acid hydroxylase superfamily)